MFGRYRRERNIFEEVYLGIKPALEMYFKVDLSMRLHAYQLRSVQHVCRVGQQSQQGHWRRDCRRMKQFWPTVEGRCKKQQLENTFERKALAHRLSIHQAHARCRVGGENGLVDAEDCATASKSAGMGELQV